MKKHENVLVFSCGTTANCSSHRMPYYPQGVLPTEKPVSGTTGKRHHGTRPSHRETYTPTGSGYPVSLLHYPNDYPVLHPTQKPVALFEYLIRTYTNPGELVLDNCMGSGTTAIACLNSGRN